MNILILNWKDITNSDMGGAEIILYEYAKRLVKDGHKVTWFTRFYPGAITQEMYDGIQIVRKGNKLTVYLEAYRYYSSLEIKPDKVLDCVNTLCWQTPLYVPKNQRIMYVNQLAREVLFYELPWGISHLSFLLEPLEYQTYKDTDCICYSASTKSDLIHVGVPEKNITVFPLGIDHARYKQGSKSKTPLFIFVARLVKMKRAVLCIMAMNLLHKKYPLTKLAIIGYGPQEQELKAFITQNSLENVVAIVNKDNLYFSKNPKDAKLKYMQEAWALLLPSVKEGWGMVVTEAAACGTTAIVSDVSGLRDSVIHGKTGLKLSPNPTPQEMARAMEDIILNEDLRNDFSQSAHNHSLAFTWEKSYSVFKNQIQIQ